MAEIRLEAFRVADADACRRLGNRLAGPEVTVQVGLDEPGLVVGPVDAELHATMIEGQDLLDNRLAGVMPPVDQGPVFNDHEIRAPFHQVSLFLVGAHLADVDRYSMGGLQSGVPGTDHWHGGVDVVDVPFDDHVVASRSNP